VPSVRESFEPDNSIHSHHRSANTPTFNHAVSSVSSVSSVRESFELDNSIRSHYRFRPVDTSAEHELLVDMPLPRFSVFVDGLLELQL
jgi:hypothetical protein